MSGLLIGPRGGPPPVQVAAPLNDVQLICLMAAQMSESWRVEDAVDKAMRMFVEAVRRSPELGRMIREAQEK